MAGLVFPNDAGEINYALCMGHNYTSTDPFHRPSSATLHPALSFTQSINTFAYSFQYVLFIYLGHIFISLCLTLGG